MNDLDCFNSSNGSNISLLSPKYESMDETDPEQECYDDTAQQLKCGEIVLNNKRSISFNCSFCETNINCLEKYLKHIMNKHLMLTQQEAESILNGVKDNVKHSSDPIKIEKLHATTEEPPHYSEESLDSTDWNANSDIQKDSKLSQPLKCESDINMKQETLLQVTTLFSDPECTNDTEYEEIELLDDYREEIVNNESVTSYNDVKYEIEVLAEENTENVANVQTNKVINGYRPVTIRKVTDADHVKTLSGDFMCALCSKLFRTKPLLNVHMKRHTDDKPYTCDYCDARFADGSNLRVHINRHLGIKPHCCVLCEKSFISTTELKLHMRSHTGERPYECDECGRKFASSGHLRSHRRRHFNDRPYECETCGKDFFDRRLLRDHEAAHSNERPFVCEICNTTFKRQKALCEHKKLHSSVKKYVCKICSKAFSQNAGLWSHMKLHHSSEGN